MKDGLEHRMDLKLGEQLTGLSPTVCRRAIRELQRVDEALGGIKRTANLPDYCHALISLLEKQTDIRTMLLKKIGGDSHGNLDFFLDHCECFLDAIEDDESNVVADGHIPPGTFGGEEESKRG